MVVVYSSFARRDYSGAANIMANGAHTKNTMHSWNIYWQKMN